MDTEESAPLVTRHVPDGDGGRGVRAVRFAKDTAPARVGTAAPATAAVFELADDESGPPVERGLSAEQGGGETHAAAREPMPLWVIPLLVAAVSRIYVRLAAGLSLTCRFCATGVLRSFIVLSPLRQQCRCLNIRTQ